MGEHMAENGTAASASIRSKRTIYERIKYDLEHDQKVAQEVALGKRVGFYKLRTQLGTGSFATVKLGIHLLTNEKVAVKIIDKTNLGDQARRLLSREISCMESLDHPNLVRLFEVIDTFPRLFLVMECAAEGDLQSRITKQGPYSEDSGRLVFAQIVAAIKHMHKRCVIHRDLKAENIFFHSETQIKVGDFGFSTETTGNLLDTFCGSPPYAAPELFSEEHYEGPLVDVWAMGIILYFMLSGRMPFHADTVSMLKKKIQDGNFNMLSNKTPACQDLIAGILTRNAEQRYIVEDIINSIWLRGGSTCTYHAGAVISGSNEGVKPLMEESGDVDGMCGSKGILANSFNAGDYVDPEILKNLEVIGVPTMDTQSFIGEPRTPVAGVYRILLHRKHISSSVCENPPANSELDAAASTTQKATEVLNSGCGTEVLNSGRGTETHEVWTERKVKFSQRSKFCTIL